MAHVILRHFIAQKLLGDLALVQALLEQSEKEVFLVLVRMLFVVAKEGVFAEQFTARTHYPGGRGEQAEPLGGTPVCG